MIDSIYAEVDYRREQVRRGVAAGSRTVRTSTDRAERATADRPRPARPGLLRAWPQAGRPVR